MHVFAADIHHGLQEYVCVCCRYTSWTAGICMCLLQIHIMDYGSLTFRCRCTSYRTAVICLRHIGLREYASYQTPGISLRYIGLRNYAAYRTAGICKHHTRLQAYAIILHMSASYWTARICQRHIRLRKYVCIISEYKNMSRSYRTVGICLRLLQIHN